MTSLRRTLAITAISGLALAAFSQPALGVTTTLGTGDCAQQVDGLTGSVMRSGNYCLIALKGPNVSSGVSGTWTVPAEITEVEILVVGGGGGGGNFGGGGAGALYEDTDIPVTPAEDINITIGSGGAGTSSTTVAGSNGLPTSFDDIVAYGGGGGSSSGQGMGATVHTSTSPGGSGGGAMASPVGPAKFVGQGSGTSNTVFPDSAGSVAGTAGVGSRNKGGDSNAVYVYLSNANYSFTNGGLPGTGISISFWQGAGGGGAGEAGGDISWQSNGLVGKTGDDFNTTFSPGAGGAGQAASFLDATSATELAVGEVVGEEVFLAGGGGGRGNFDAATSHPTVWDYNNPVFLSYSLGGAFGLGGGGGSGANREINGVTGPSAGPGFANTGGGGRFNASGGSGLVVIRYVVPGSEPPVDPPVDPPIDNGDMTTLADTGAPQSLVGIGAVTSAVLIGLGLAAVRQSRSRRGRTNLS